MIQKINNIQTPRIASNKFISGSVPIRNLHLTTGRQSARIAQPKPNSTAQSTAHAHDHNIFSDMPTLGSEPVTLEILPSYDASRLLIRKNIDVSAISTDAIHDAKHKGYVTVVQKITNDSPDTPYGYNVLKDKQYAQALLLALKKKYNYAS